MSILIHIHIYVLVEGMVQSAEFIHSRCVVAIVILSKLCILLSDRFYLVTNCANFWLPFAATFENQMNSVSTFLMKHKEGL